MARSVSDLVRDLAVMRKARAQYLRRATTLDEQVAELPASMALTKGIVRRQANIARKAATAELANPDPRERPTDMCDGCPPGKCDRCSACTERVLDKFA